MVSLPEIVVDLHSQLFSPRYLPLKRILKEKRVPGWVAGLAERLFNLLTGKADFIDGPHRAVIDGVGENDSLEQLADLLTTVVSSEMARRVVSRGVVTLEGGRSERVTATQAVLKSDQLYGVLEEVEEVAWTGTRAGVIRYRVDEVTRLVGQLETAQGLTERGRLDLIGDWVFRRFRSPLLSFSERLQSTILGDASGTSLDYVKFLLLMLSKETTLREALFAGYDEEMNVGRVSRMMMDVQETYGKEKPYHWFYMEQIKRMEAVVEGANAKLVGFVAFDPRHSDGLRIVKYALAHGDCGVSIYPPIGSPAYDIGAGQEARFGALIAHCSQERIPILTHCSPVGPDELEGPGVLSDPDYWLEFLGENRDLKLCYGHAGGGGGRTVDPETGLEIPYFGWYSKNAEEWAVQDNCARKVVEQCCRFPNVYCDFSFFGAIVNDRERAAHFKRNLITALGGPNGDLHFGNKIMYGSDWHMPKMARHGAEFLAFWREMFDDFRIAPYRDGFFHKNALRFLSLDSMAPRYERISMPAFSDLTANPSPSMFPSGNSGRERRGFQ